MDFNDKDVAALFSAVSLGEATREFLESETGKYLKGCAAHEVWQCALEIAKLPEDKPAQRRTLQIKMQAAENFMVWVNDAIVAGESAKQEIDLTRGDE